MTKRAVKLSIAEADRIISRLRLESGAAVAANPPGQYQTPGFDLKATTPVLTGVQRWQGLGRLAVGQLNKTEQAYSDHLDARRRDGSILWFKAHAFNVRLADNTFYRIDFLVMAADHALEIHEVKGGYTSEKGQIKIKLCAEILPVFRFFKATKQTRNNGGGWLIEDFST